MKNILIASIIAGIPSLSFGEEPEAYKGGKLHGNPHTQDENEAAKGHRRNDSKTADRALGAAADVTKNAGDAGDITALLARVENVKDGNRLPRTELVELRASLQRFRASGSDEQTAKIDAEIDRLEAVILGMSVEGSDASDTATE